MNSHNGGNGGDRAKNRSRRQRAGRDFKTYLGSAGTTRYIPTLDPRWAVAVVWPMDYLNDRCQAFVSVTTNQRRWFNSRADLALYWHRCRPTLSNILSTISLLMMIGKKYVFNSNKFNGVVLNLNFKILCSVGRSWRTKPSSM